MALLPALLSSRSFEPRRSFSGLLRRSFCDAQLFSFFGIADSSRSASIMLSRWRENSHVAAEALLGVAK